MRLRWVLTAPSTIIMPIPGKSPRWMLSSRFFPAECWALSSMTKVAARPAAISPQSSFRIFAVLPVAKQTATSAGTSPRRCQQRNHAQNAQWLHSRARRRVRAQDHPVELPQFFGRPQREQGRPLISVVDNLQRPRGLLAQSYDLVIRQRGVAPIDVSNDISVGRQHNVFVDQSWSRESRGRRYGWCSESRTCAPRPPSGGPWLRPSRFPVRPPPAW